MSSPSPTDCRPRPRWASRSPIPTAGAGLLWRAHLSAGDWVLVHGAAGGVGLAGVEIAKAMGCRVIARAGAAKHALLRARGADVVLDSAAPFRDAVRGATGGQGVACVLDTIGGPAFDESLRCLGDGGTLVVIGFAGGGIPTVAANILLLKNIAVAGVNWGTYVGWSPGDNRRASRAARAGAVGAADGMVAGRGAQAGSSRGLSAGAVPRGDGRGQWPAQRRARGAAAVTPGAVDDRRRFAPTGHRSGDPGH